MQADHERRREGVNGVNLRGRDGQAQADSDVVGQLSMSR
jgi:hypothetical protein